MLVWARQPFKQVVAESRRPSNSGSLGKRHPASGHLWAIRNAAALNLGVAQQRSERRTGAGTGIGEASFSSSARCFAACRKRSRSRDVARNLIPTTSTRSTKCASLRSSAKNCGGTLKETRLIMTKGHPPTGQLADKTVEPLWFPAGDAIRYACLKCSGTLASCSRLRAQCACGNARIEDGRVVLQDITQFRVVIEAAHNVLKNAFMPTWKAGMLVHELAPPDYTVGSRDEFASRMRRPCWY